MLLVVAAAALWYARRHGFTGAPRGKPRQLRIVERVTLSRGAALLVVEYDGRRLLIGQSADRVSLISGPSPGKEAPDREPG